MGSPHHGGRAGRGGDARHAQGRPGEQWARLVPPRAARRRDLQRCRHRPGVSIIVSIVLIAIFLLTQAIPSLRVDQANFLTSAKFETSDANNLNFGIRDLLRRHRPELGRSRCFLAVPVAISIAIFLTNYAPRRLSRVVRRDRRPAGRRAVHRVRPVGDLCPGPEARADPRPSSTRTWAGSSCSRDGNVSLAGGGTIFTAGIVLAVMILPIITSVTREVFSLTPKGHVEAAQALGATKWEVVRMTVFPYGRSGMIAASMLGLGRALGETIAILIILRTAAQAGGWSLFDGGYTFASKIASAAAEFSAPLPTGAYIAAGFVLFALTFIVNALARLPRAGGRVSAG